MRRSAVARLERLERIIAPIKPCDFCDENCTRFSWPGGGVDSNEVECPNPGSCRLIVVHLAFDPTLRTIPNDP